MTISMNLELDKSDMAKLRRKLSDRRTKIGRVLEPAADPMVNYFQTVGKAIERRARENAAKTDDTGRLRSGIIFRFVPPGRAEVISKAKYSKFVHDGTRPHWPPPQAIAGWARRHGIPAFLVGRAISQHGTKANPFLRDAYEETMRRDVAPGIRQVASAAERNFGR